MNVSQLPSPLFQLGDKFNIEGHEYTLSRMEICRRPTRDNAMDVMCTLLGPVAHCYYEDELEALLEASGK